MGKINIEQMLGKDRLREACSNVYDKAPIKEGKG